MKTLFLVSRNVLVYHKINLSKYAPNSKNKMGGKLRRKKPMVILLNNFTEDVYIKSYKEKYNKTAMVKSRSKVYFKVGRKKNW